MRALHVVFVALVVSGCGRIGGSWPLTLSPEFIHASDAQFAALRDALLPGGIMLASLAPDEAAAMLGGPVTEKAAADEAVREYGKVDPPMVFEALVTVHDLQPPINRVPMYVIQLTGMNLPPLGGGPLNGGGGAIPDGLIHHELIVFVDAATGEEVFSVTGR